MRRRDYVISRPGDLVTVRNVLVVCLIGAVLCLLLPGVSLSEAVLEAQQVPRLPTDADKKFVLYLTAATVILGIGFIGLYCYIRRGTIDDNFSRHFIILTVIFSSLFLIVAGYTERQTAPVFALLGTIIGYL